MKVLLVVSAVGVFVGSSLFVAIFFRGFLRESLFNKYVTRTQKSSCVSDIRSIQTVEDAMNMGKAYFGGAKGYDLGCARGGYGTALNLDERGAILAWYQLGRIDFLEGNFDQALSRFAKQMEFFGDKDLPNVHYMLGLTYGYRAHKTGSAEDWARAEKEFRIFSELDPESPWSRVDLAWVLFSQEKYEEMKEPLLKALEKHPDNAWVLNMYGLALLNTGGKKEALESFRKAEISLKKFTPEEWGKTYPGNDPARWESGLSEMKDLIKKNIRLSKEV